VFILSGNLARGPGLAQDADESAKPGGLVDGLVAAGKVGHARAIRCPAHAMDDLEEAE
jgi:hypothetical protein